MMLGGSKRISLTALLTLVLAQGCAQLAPSPTQQASSPSPTGHANEESASRTDGSGPQVVTTTPIQPIGSWPTTTVAEREFPTAEVVIEDRSKPWKLWLMSSPANGTALALEFFSGERVADVQVDSTGPGKRLAYSFTDPDGNRYASTQGTPSTVGTDQPVAYGGWDDREGRGHEVVLGGILFERKTVTGPDGVPKTVNTAVDVRHLFGGQSICETAAYVARTNAPRWQVTEPGFEPVTKIIADYDDQRNCWVTRPTHAVNLDDNTILIVTGGKAVRLSSRDLSPVGTVRGIRIIDVKE